MATKIRKAKYADVPDLIDMICSVLETEKKIGNKNIAEGMVLRGGATIEFAHLFDDPNCRIVVAERNDNLIGFIIGNTEHCRPTDKYDKCLRVWLDYINDDSLAGPETLRRMWEHIRDWGQKRGAEYSYCHIHPGNLRSIRAAKKAGFGHHYTQFINVFNDKEVEEE
jgi:hypothetical protein